MTPDRPSSRASAGRWVSGDVQVRAMSTGHIAPRVRPVSASPHPSRGPADQGFCISSPAPPLQRYSSEGSILKGIRRQKSGIASAIPGNLALSALV
ncbi:hypothetical protein B0T16DRAFT_146542 [Cercophora newfieldiana]|uniref:Uncharacterized protein n=1 Tax=Cercophora newfieldiana TaxID=92897 RepID=A0AA39Y493_9PEZI|nr:hypothetical protein B0T16DRAFT_146542 [Cercophora newfieldiana]